MVFMAESGVHQIDKKTWNKWSFYINIVVFIIIAIFIYLLIIDSHNAGSGVTNSWLHVSRDIAFLAVSLTIIFFQLFKYQRIVIRRSW